MEKREGDHPREALLPHEVLFDEEEVGELHHEEEGCGQYILLGCGLVVLFVQWTLMTFFMPFFALSGPGSKISANVQGFVFAAFPAGTAAAAPFIGKLLVKFGTRNTVLAGLGLMTVFISLFGLIPTLVAEGASMEYLLMLTGFLYGACSTLAETGTYAILTYSYPDKLGKVFAATEIMVGAGATLGPVFGGILYDQLVSLGSEAQFMVCCLVFAVVPLLTFFPILRFMPNSYIDEGGHGESSFSAICTPAVIMSLLAVYVTGASFSSISPTMPIRLQNKPFHFSVGTTGTLFLVGGLVYMALATPLGIWVDRQSRTGPMRLSITLGLFALSIAFLMDGPLKIGGLELDSFDNLAAFMAGQCLLGMGQALILIPCLPEMLAPFPAEAEALKATVTGLQMSAYALGCVSGPIASTALLSLETPALCRASDAAVPSSDLDAQQRQHCFDGFCTIFTGVYLAFAVLMALHTATSSDGWEENGTGFRSHATSFASVRSRAASWATLQASPDLKGEVEPESDLLDSDLASPPMGT